MAIRRFATRKGRWYHALFAGVLLNQSVIDFVVPLRLNLDPPQINVNVPESALKEYSDLPGDFTTLDYLNLASSIVYNDGHKGGLCTDYAYGTFDIYVRLAKMNNRDDLVDNIRLAAGRGRGGSHMYIEYETNEGILPYNTGIQTERLAIEDIKAYSARTFRDTNRLETIMARSEFGTCFFYPAGEVFITPGGALRVLSDDGNY